MHQKPPEEQQGQIETNESVADCRPKKKEENDDLFVFKLLYQGNDFVCRLA